MTEMEQAVALANRVLDKPYIDPDGDICLLARQFLRSVERPSVVGAKPLCLDCHSAGIGNCSHFDECSGRWVYVPKQNKETEQNSMNGCCSYEDTWRPGIEGWGESDAEARKGGYVGVPDWDQLVNMYTKSEERVAQLEKQNEALKAKLFCNCGEPYFGAQIVGTPLRCERCGREVGEN